MMIRMNILYSEATMPVLREEEYAGSNSHWHIRLGKN